MDKETQEYIDTAVKDYVDTKIEGLYLSLTEIVGNAMAHHAFCNQTNAKFYKDYPEFKNHKEIVASVVEMVDGKSPAVDYAEVLKQAIPKIRERIAITKNMDVSSVSKNPLKNLGNGDL